MAETSAIVAGSPPMPGDIHGGKVNLAPSPSQLMHIGFTLTSLMMATWSLYLDTRYLHYGYGWSRGVWLLRLTHWSLMFTILFLAVSAADALTLGLILSAPRRWLLFPALVMALMVDTNYFMVLIPRRVLGIDKRIGHKGIITPAAAHKHLLNLTWILGDAGTYPYPGGKAPGHNAIELVLFGIAVPIVICASYFQLARAIKSRKQGPKVLRALNIPFEDEDDDDEGSITSFTTDGDESLRRVYPGRWIYSSFRHKKLRSVFLLQPLFYGPLAWSALTGAEQIMVGRPPLQAAALAITAVITPGLYGPVIWERNKATLYQAIVQTRKDLFEMLNYMVGQVLDWADRNRREFREFQKRMREAGRRRRERIKKMIPHVKEYIGSTVANFEFMVKELSMAFVSSINNVASAFVSFFTEVLPDIVRYIVEVAADLLKMVYNDMLEGAAEVYEWLETVELDEME